VSPLAEFGPASESNITQSQACIDLGRRSWFAAQPFKFEEAESKEKDVPEYVQGHYDTLQRESHQSIITEK
jgi:hypothetical protein